jgi:hypothetical protein
MQGENVNPKKEEILDCTDYAALCAMWKKHEPTLDVMEAIERRLLFIPYLEALNDTCGFGDSIALIFNSAIELDTLRADAHDFLWAMVNATEVQRMQAALLAILYPQDYKSASA